LAELTSHHFTTTIFATPNFAIGVKLC